MNTNTKVSKAERAAATVAARKRHHDGLAAVARQLTGRDLDGFAIWRKLRRIEHATHRAAEQYCNGFLDDAGVDQACVQAERAVGLAFGGRLPKGFFVNRDPRGYALKLEAGSYPGVGLHEDWGGYQILAAEID